MSDDHTDDDFSGTDLLQAALVHLLSDPPEPLADIAEALGLPVLVDDSDTPVEITGVRTFADHGAMTHDQGVWVEFSDGSEFALTIGVARQPTYGVNLRTPAQQRQRHRALRRH